MTYRKRPAAALPSSEKKEALALLKKTAQIIAARKKEVLHVPTVRRAHPRTGEIVLISGFSNELPDFLQTLHSILFQCLFEAGFRVRLSEGKERDLKQAEGILVTDASVLPHEWDDRFRQCERCFAVLSPERRGQNRVSFHAAGVWIQFFLTLEEKNTKHIFYDTTEKKALLFSSELPSPILDLIRERKHNMTIHPAGKIPDEIPEDSVILLTDPSRSAYWNKRIQPGNNIWTVSAFSDAGTEKTDYSFFADKEKTATAMLQILFRQLEHGSAEDPGVILPLEWYKRDDR